MYLYIYYPYFSPPCLIKFLKKGVLIYKNTHQKFEFSPLLFYKPNSIFCHLLRITYDLTTAIVFKRMNLGIWEGFFEFFDRFFHIWFPFSIPDRDFCFMIMLKPVNLSIQSQCFISKYFAMF